MKVTIENFAIGQGSDCIEFGLHDDNDGVRKPGRVWVCKEGITIGAGRTDRENASFIRWETLLDAARTVYEEKRPSLESLVSAAADKDILQQLNEAIVRNFVLMQHFYFPPRRNG